VATRSQQFRHASLTAVLGGVTLDLSEATPATTGAVIDATTILGGVTILVPRGWIVEVRGIPVLGGWDDTTDRSAIGSGAPRVEVRALVALGGLEVKHAGRWAS
jgi:predicted membrane protein